MKSVVMKLKIVSLMCACALLSSCANNDQQVQRLETEKAALAAELAKSNQEVERLKGRQREFNKELEEMHGKVGSLSTEKSSRVQESSKLRGTVREYILANIESMKEFLVKGDLLDYMGGEPVKRSNTDNQTAMLVDMVNLMPRSGMLTGFGGYFYKTGSVIVKVLRPVGSSLVVIWESPTMPTNQTGFHQYNFPVTVGVERGDMVAFYFPQGVNVTYDNGVSDVRWMSGDVKPGGLVAREQLQGAADRRAYSVGVFGLLN